MSSKRAQKEKTKQLKSIEELNDEVAGLREHLDQILGVRSREVQNVHYLVSQASMYQERFMQLNHYAQKVTEFFEEKSYKEEFDEWLKKQAKELEKEAEENADNTERGSKLKD